MIAVAGGAWAVDISAAVFIVDRLVEYKGRAAPFALPIAYGRGDWELKLVKRAGAALVARTLGEA